MERDGLANRLSFRKPVGSADSGIERCRRWICRHYCRESRSRRGKFRTALAVSSSGVAQTKDYQNEFSEFYMSIHYDAGSGFVYGDDGTVVNPAKGQRVGSFQASGLMIPDSTLNRAFFLGQ